MRRLLVLTACLATACGPAVVPAASRPVPLTADLGALEDEILHDLGAVDRRFANRARLTPSEEDLQRVTMAAVLREDPTVAVVDGAIDPFSFDARARGLESVGKKAARLPAGASNERTLLLRLVAEEQVRLEEERALPRSASSLIRAIVDTWQPPKTPNEAVWVDRWLARRLGELHEAMQSASDPAASLDVVRARELDDALDALERLTSGYPKATQALVRVREALEAVASRPAAKARADWNHMARRLQAHLGFDGPAHELARDLEATEADLRARALAAIASAGLHESAIATSLEKQVFVSGPCLDAVFGSRVASMAVPPEREPSCHLRHLVANGEDDPGRAIALALMHDHVAVALWALDVARGEATIAEAEGRHGLLVPVLPDARARYERIALARPVAAIGAGATASALIRGGDPVRSARAWNERGDLPLDLLQQDLGREARRHVNR